MWRSESDGWRAKFNLNWSTLRLDAPCDWLWLKAWLPHLCTFDEVITLCSDPITTRISLKSQGLILEMMSVQLRPKTVAIRCMPFAHWLLPSMLQLQGLIISHGPWALLGSDGPEIFTSKGWRKLNKKVNYYFIILSSSYWWQKRKQINYIFVFIPVRALSIKTLGQTMCRLVNCVFVSILNEAPFTIKQ